MVTTIQVSDELWKKLNDMKQKGESFEDVILRSLKIKKEKNLDSAIMKKSKR